MSWLSRLSRRRYSVIQELGEIREGRVEIEGVVDIIEPLHDPLEGERCIAIDYRAWPPSTTLGLDGGSAFDARAFQIEARQSVDFLLTDGTTRVLIRAEGGRDVAELHRELLERYGVGLRAETRLLQPGVRARVAGQVESARAAGGSPHREEPYAAIVKADRFWVV